MFEQPMASPLSHIQLGSSKVPSPAIFREALKNYLQTPECRHLIHLIRHAQTNTASKTVLLLSQFPKEGRTFVSALLALAAASLLRKRVLVVDTAHLHPTDSLFQHLLIQNEQSSDGAIELALAKRIERVTHSKLDTEAPIVPEDLSALVPDFAAANYIQRSRESYDFIIIDGCALQSVNTDTLHPAILAQHSDLRILVASSRSIERNSLNGMRGLLAQYGIRPTGVVFNRGGGA
jgi:Mrp family chromosome partitioning ATPase